MKNILKRICFLAALLEMASALCLYAAANTLPASFYILRDAVYMQSSSAVEVMRLYTRAKEDLERTLSDAHLYTALSRCSYLLGINFQAEGKKNEAAACYVQGAAWAEDSISIIPSSEAYQYLAANTALACWVKSKAWALANIGKIESYAEMALELDPCNLGAQYVIAAKYIQAPFPVGNLKKGAVLLRKIIDADFLSLEKEDVFNIYLTMSVVCEKENDKQEAARWFKKAVDLYPSNKFNEVLLK